MRIDHPDVVRLNELMAGAPRTVSFPMWSVEDFNELSIGCARKLLLELAYQIDRETRRRRRPEHAAVVEATLERVWRQLMKSGVAQRAVESDDGDVAGPNALAQPVGGAQPTNGAGA